jgi:glutamate carboxypeptidase
MTSHGEKAAAWLADKVASMEETLAPLVAINSFTENVTGGNEVGARFRTLFGDTGLDARVVESRVFANHLVFSSRSKTDAAPVALVGHLDTVFPPGTFEGYSRDGQLARGPGVLDMKGGLVVVLYALRALASTGGLEDIAPLRLVIVGDEEVGSPEGQKVIAEAIAGSRACLVFEAGRAKDAIITRRKGTGAVTAMAHGVAAHAGNNHTEGKNAIWALARFVDRAQALTDYPRGVTINVGKVSGGQGKNTVPDRADAWLDTRFCTRADGEAVVEALRVAAREAAASVPGTRIELEGGIARLPLERTPESEALLHTYAASARASGLGGDEAPLIGGGSDASTSSAMGIPSIDGLGPRGKGFHTKDEQIEIASLVPKAQALARFLASVVSAGDASGGTKARA